MPPVNGKGIKTRVLVVSEENFEAALEEAAEILRRGGTVAFPTETVYGLGANGLDPGAVNKIFEAKARPPKNPLSLLVHSREDLEKVARNIPKKAFKLMEAFWPGPLTIVLEKKDVVPAITLGGLPSIGVRMPDHRVPLELIRRTKTPLAAPSANLSGRPSPISAAHVLADLDGRIDAVVDGGDAAIGLESTVVDLTVEPPLVLRPGAIGLGELEAVIGPVRAGYPGAEAAGGNLGEGEVFKKGTGQKYAHYTPKTPVVLVEGEENAIYEKLRELLENYMRGGQKAGLLLSTESAALLSLGGLPGGEKFLLGPRQDPGEAAKKLFEGLRALDAKGLDVILADGSFSSEGLGAALLNRLREAASVRFSV